MMPIKLDPYQQRLTPQGAGLGGSSGRAAVPNVPTNDPIASNLLALGVAGGALAGSMAENQRRVDDQRAAQEADLAFANFQRSTFESEQRARDAYDPMSGAEFTPPFMESFDKGKDTLIAQTPNPNARAKLEYRLAELGAHVLQRSVHFESAQRVAGTQQQIDAQRAAYGPVVAADQSAYGPAREALLSFVDSTMLPEILKSHHRSLIEHSLALDTGRGYAVRQPAAAYAAFSEALGMQRAPVAPVPAAAPSSPPSDLTPGQRDAWALLPAREREAFAHVARASNQGKSAIAYVYAEGQVPPHMAASGTPTEDTGTTQTYALQPDVSEETRKHVDRPDLAFINRLKVSDIITLRNEAHAAMQRDVMQQRVALTRDVTNQEAAAKAGLPVPEIPAARFAAAYPEDLDTATAHYGTSQGWVVFGADKRAMQRMPLNTIEQYLVDAAPRPGDETKPDFSQRYLRYNQLQHVANDIAAERKRNGIGALAAQGVVDIKPLAPSDSAAFESELVNRQSVATQVRGVYLPEPTPFSPNEAAALAQMLNDSPPSRQLAIIDSMRKSLTDPATYHTAMQQIRPDSPVTAAAGSLLQSKGSVTLNDGKGMSARGAAETILAGENLLNKTKATKAEDGRGGAFAMPTERDLRTKWASEIGDAFRGNPEGESVAYQTYRAYYAGAAARAGNYKGIIDTDIAGDAVKVATGGVYKHNGHQVLMPFGMSDATFESAIAGEYARVAPLAGYRVPGLSALELVNVQGAGYRYYLAANGKVIFDVRGYPLELNLAP